MKYEQFIYRELKKIADQVGFDVGCEFPNSEVFALELGYFLDNDRTYSNRDANYYRELFNNKEAYPVWYQNKLKGTGRSRIKWEKKMSV